MEITLYYLIKRMVEDVHDEIPVHFVFIYCLFWWWCGGPKYDFFYQWIDEWENQKSYRNHSLGVDSYYGTSVFESAFMQLHELWVIWKHAIHVNDQKWTERTMREIPSITYQLSSFFYYTTSIQKRRAACVVIVAAGFARVFISNDDLLSGEKANMVALFISEVLL